jgi:hypothetical protein
MTEQGRYCEVEAKLGKWKDHGSGYADRKGER